MNQSLQNKVAVITGAGRGIGKAIAMAFAEAGAAVCCAARTEPEIVGTASAIEAKGGQAIAVVSDVTVESDVNEMVTQTVRRFGGIDILVLNAGVNLDRNTIEQGNIQDWRSVMEINLFAPYLCARAAIPYLKSRGAGKIITIGSGMGHRGSPGNSAYCCSKAGLWMLTRVLAQEVVQFNISVNELIPGPVKTSMTDNEDARSGVAFTASDEWIKEPDDVTSLALWMAAQPDVGPTAQSFSLMRRDK